jgi:secretion/DNA translocation related TadE-like protein
VKERGAAGVVLLGVVAVAMVVSLLIADLSGYLAARLHAAAAADAAALAAAPATFAEFGTGGSSPAEAAAATAEANGTRLVECRCPPDPSWASRRVVVTVARSVDLIVFGTPAVTASSAAEFDPTALVDR